MTKGRIRRSHSDKFKAKVALAAIKGDRTVNELCQEFGVAAGQIYAWRDRLLDSASTVFTDKRSKDNQKDEVEKLHRVIGRLTVENDFLSNVFNRSK